MIVISLILNILGFLFLVSCQHALKAILKEVRKQNELNNMAAIVAGKASKN